MTRMHDDGAAVNPAGEIASWSRQPTTSAEAA